MKNTTDLIELIRTATKAEKRNFSLTYNSDKKKTKKYIKLLQILENSNTIPLEYTPSDINDLYEKFQKNLSDLYFNKSTSSKTRNHLNFIETLYSKGLFTQCINHIGSCKKYLLQNEQFYNFFEVTKIEKKIYGALGKFDKIDFILNEEKKVSKTIETNNNYETLYFEISTLRSKFNNLLLDDVRKNLEIIIKNPLMENIEFAPTLSSKLRFIEIKSNYYFPDLSSMIFYNI